jgi:hypothetical protein
MKHLSSPAMHGLLGALLNFAMLVLLYLVNMDLLAEWWVGVLAMGIFVVVMCTGSLASRKERGGNMTFGQAYGASMVVALAAQMVSAVLTLMLYHLIAPELPGVLEELTMTKTKEMMEGFGVSGKLLDAQMKELSYAMKEAYTVGGMLKNSVGAMVMWALVGLIVAAVTKRVPKSEFS